MSERSDEQIAKDLRDGLRRMVENKTLDGIPWYCAEAMAAEVALLRHLIDLSLTPANEPGKSIPRKPEGKEEGHE